MNYQMLWVSNKPIRQLFWGSFASSIGDWCRHVAIVGLAISYSGAGLNIAVLLILEVIPLLFFGPISGVIIDRISPRKVMLVCDMGRAFLSLGFLFMQTGDQLWLAYCLTAFIAIFDAPSMAAQQTLISRLADNDSLVTAHSLFSIGMGLCIAIGAVSATGIAAILGNMQIFIFDAATFVVSCFFLLMIPEGKNPRQTANRTEDITNSYLIDLKEGFLYVRTNAQARALILFNTLRSVGSGMIYFLLGVFGYSVFNAGIEGVGLFHVTFGVGFFIGAIIAKEWATRIGWGRYTLLMGLAAVIEGLFVVLFSRADTFILALFLLSIAYMGRSVVITLFNTVSSRLIDERFKGRYFALNRVFSYTAMGVTMLLCGYGLSLFSARQLAFFAGVFLFINGVLWVIISHKTPKAVFEFSE